jgi:hypothetical protein
MNRKNTLRKIKIGSVIVFLFLLGAFGWLVADTATKPLNVQLRAHIKICQKADDGSWKLIDEAGPANLNFQATVWDFASGKKAASDFVWSTKTKNGKPYSVRLAGQADLKWNAGGQLDGDLPFEITLDGKTARVAGKLTTESMQTPIGMLRGKRASGIPGIDTSAFTFVSANDLQLPGEKPMKLVCTEEYRLVPKK